MYCSDTKSNELIKRYEYASGMSGEAYEKYITLCVDIYNSTSPYKETFFEGWSQEEINDMLYYSDEVSELRDANDAILIEYNKLDPEETATFNQKTVDFYKQLLKNNNNIARKFKDSQGNYYTNYYDYASDNVYVRDYGETELTAMREYVGQYIVPLCVEEMGKWQKLVIPQGEEYYLYDDFMNSSYRSNDTLKNYWDSYVNSFDGSMKAGLNHMFENNNYAFVNGKNSVKGAFTATIYEKDAPFCYFGPGYQTLTTVAHEIGHYYAGLHSEGSLMYDLAETHSQGNEWMLMSYLEDRMLEMNYQKAYMKAFHYQMLNQLWTIMVATIVDDFESRLYKLTDAQIDKLNLASLENVMKSVCKDYGGIAKVNSLVDIQSYWRMVALDNPVYYISYATSGMVALSLYSAIEQDTATGREKYRKLVEEIDYEAGFLGNLQALNLASPFDETAYSTLYTLVNGK